MQRISDALELLTAQHDEIEALIAEIADTVNPDRRAQAITELADRLTVHLAAEQVLFYPAVSMLISREVHQELLAEHAEIKRVLADLLWLEGEDMRLERKLASLKALMDIHATWQERELFETVAETRSAEELVALGTEITAWVDSIIDASANAAASAAVSGGSMVSTSVAA
ncbi:MAG: hemerythrin domain-containing protein [Kofleriaceae bacterium]